MGCKINEAVLSNGFIELVKSSVYFATLALSFFCAAASRHREKGGSVIK